jgi:hypothetical protein
MKKWITCLVATGLLATTAFVTTAADNVTITLGTNTTASTFNVLDNAGTVLLNVTAGDNQTMIITPAIKATKLSHSELWGG